MIIFIITIVIKYYFNDDLECIYITSSATRTKTLFSGRILTYKYYFNYKTSLNQLVLDVISTNALKN